MIRVVDERGSQWIGLVRGPLLERFLRGERVCLPGHVAPNGIVYAHICLVLRDTNEELLQASREHFPDGPLPTFMFEHVTKDEPT